MCIYEYIRWVRRRGGNISVDFLLLLYETKFLNKFQYDDFLKLIKKITALTVQIHYNLQNHPTSHLVERLVNLKRRREHFVGLSLQCIRGSGSGFKILPPTGLGGHCTRYNCTLYQSSVKIKRSTLFIIICFIYSSGGRAGQRRFYLW